MAELSDEVTEDIYLVLLSCDQILQEIASIGELGLTGEDVCESLLCFEVFPHFFRITLHYLFLLHNYGLLQVVDG